MGKLQKNEIGFSAVEVVLVLVVVLIGAAGFVVYRSHSKARPAPVAGGTASAKTTKSESTVTSGPQSGWSTYTNKTVGFSISYPNGVEGDSACATSSTVHNGSVSTRLISDAPNYYVAAKNSIRFNLTWGANQTYDTSGCTQVPTDASSVRAQNSPVKTGAQYEYSVVNLPLFVKKVSGESAVQAELRNYWSDTTVTVSGWKNSSSGSYEVPASIRCASSEMDTMEGCGPLSSNYDLRYYPAQKIMFYYVQGQAAHLMLAGGADAADQRIVNSFKVL